MNPLLQRQLKKYLDPSLLKAEGIDAFLSAVEDSYDTYDDQFKMLQRAMRISSDELFDANHQLRKEAEGQKKILDNLSAAINALNIEEFNTEEGPVEIANLAVYIKEQSEKLQQSALEQKALLQRLEKKNQALTDYAHMVSHDLKSPLRSISALTSWIQEDNYAKLDDAGKSNFDSILKNVEKMDALISGILNYSTIDQAVLNQYQVNIKTLVEEIVDLLYIPDHIRIKIDEHLPIISGDQFRLQQLFQNLIHNAIKSIDKESGLVEINVDNAGDFWCFEIKDNGRGIPKRHHDKIFRIFEKIDNDKSSTGIGLSIVKKVVDHYGGNLQIESEEEKGTSIYFTLPK
ncbi:sensor histidine kinase [Flavimarina sp. Hel_I_48]|uniref:sensor histidine kinase n=1 Tax=Flavimarina sp. Hel_I_48 TaxID=1392488 RepID=UPI0004DFBD9F|nr:HAMP domain-containing sensor histidine kinase [Flavimarina sp. Hel_I_48]